MNKLLYILYASSLILVGFAVYFGFTYWTAPNTVFFTTENQLLDNNTFQIIEAPETPPHHIIALFTSPASLCGSCINDMRSFSKALVNEKVFTKTVTPTILLFSEDETVLKSYQNAIDFPATIKTTTTLPAIQELLRYEDEEVARQMMLIDTQTKRVFFRVKLKTGGARAQAEQEEILSNAQKAFQAIP